MPDRTPIEVHETCIVDNITIGVYYLCRHVPAGCEVHNLLPRFRYSWPGMSVQIKANVIVNTLILIACQAAALVRAELLYSLRLCVTPALIPTVILSPGG